MDNPFERLEPRNHDLEDHNTAAMFNTADEMELRLEGKEVRDSIRDELWSRGFKRPVIFHSNARDRFDRLVDPDATPLPLQGYAVISIFYTYTRLNIDILVSSFLLFVQSVGEGRRVPRPY